MLRCFLLLVMVLSSGCGGDSEGTPPAGKKPAVRRSLSTRSESGSKESDRLKALRKAVRGGDTAAKRR